MPDLMPFVDAVALLDRSDLTPTVETVPLADTAGRFLAADVSTDRDYPPFRKALMDGFAVRGGGPWRVVGEVAAGRTGEALGDGEAVAIMTGAPLPDGAEAVVPVEVTRVEGETLHAETPTHGAAIAAAGSDRPANVVVLERGVELRPTHLAVLAQLGITAVPVGRRPRVGVLTTGDEVVPANVEPGPAQVRDASTPMLAALLPRLGCLPVLLGHVADDADVLRWRIDDALPGLDALLVTGGMSMGRRDYVPGVLEELGFTFHIRKLALKPGKPFAWATREQVHAFGLPGNPVSGYVCTQILAARVLRRLAGARGTPAPVPMPLAAPLTKSNGPRTFLQPARLGPAGVTPLAWRGSADVFTLADADALLLRPPDDPPRSAGEPVEIVRIM